METLKQMKEKIQDGMKKLVVKKPEAKKPEAKKPEAKKTETTVEKANGYSPEWLKSHQGIKLTGKGIDGEGTYEHSAGIRRPRIIPSIGTVLEGKHNGKVFTVKVSTGKTEELKGKIVFLFNNKEYRSLSKVAELCTGFPTSGPNFFGLGWGNGSYRYGNVQDEGVVKKLIHSTKK